MPANDWSTRMLDRALRKYYGCTYGCEMVGDVAECTKARKAAISLAPPLCQVAGSDRRS